MFKTLLQFLELYDIVITSVAVTLAAVQVASGAVVALLTYTWFRAKAAAIAARVTAKKVVKLDGESGSRRLRLSLGTLFQWTVTANPEKGIAGGHIRLDFPLKSSLLLAACYLFLASVIGVASQFIVPGIFLFFGLYHLSKWARSVSRLRYLATLGAAGVGGGGDVGREPFTVLGTVREAWRVYRRSPVRLIVATFGVTVASVASFGLLAGPADAGMCAALHDALHAPGRRFPGYRFSAALSRPMTTSLCALASLGLVLIGGVFLVVPGVIVLTLVLFAAPICVLEELGAWASIRESTRRVALRPLANFGVLLVAAVPLVLAPLAGPAGLAVDLLYLPFVHALVMAAYVAQRSRDAGSAIVVRVDGDAGEMREAA